MGFEMAIDERFICCLESTGGLLPAEAAPIVCCLRFGQAAGLGLANSTQIDHIARHGFFRKVSSDTTLASALCCAAGFSSAAG